MATHNPHLNEEQLAALVERGLGEVETVALENHLLRCRVCMAAYADAIRIRGEWVRGAGLRTADTDLKELGYRQLPQSVVPRKGEGQPVHLQFNPAQRRSSRPVQRWLVAAVVPLIVVGLGWFGLSGQMSGQLSGNVTHPALALVTGAVNEASHYGMILPGSGASTWSPGDTFRTAGEASAELSGALAVLAAQTDDHAAQLLRAEGLLASGRLDLARLLTDSTRQEFPEDIAWQHLAAVVAFRENDLARAEILLRGVLVTEPENVEAQFNLGLVLAAGDQMVEARRIFLVVSGNGAYPLAQRRAEVELNQLMN